MEELGGLFRCAREQLDLCARFLAIAISTDKMTSITSSTLLNSLRRVRSGRVRT